MASHAHGETVTEAVPRLRVIDFRARPNTPENQQYLEPRLADIHALGLRSIDGSEWYRAPVETVDEFVARLDRRGIDAVVFVGRNRGTRPGWALTNEWVAEMAARHPGRIFGFAGVDAERLETAADAIRTGVTELGLAGANLDPFQIDASADDPRFDVVYETCSELGVPLIMTFGAGPGLSSSLRCWPLALDVVAQRFPTLTIVACHGAWPFVNEMTAVAWRNPNIYFDNSFYHFAPGAEILVDAANRLVGDKMVYASAYPFRPLEQTLDGFVELGFDEAVLQDVLYGNAARILGLEPAAAAA